MAMTPLQPDDPEALGGYRLEGRIGEGGQAVVYLGVTPSGGHAAVKMFGSEWLADPDARHQLAAEVAAMRGVAAFGTARLLAEHLDADPPYLVSEYIPGPNLAQAVHERGPLRGGELDRFALAVLTALRAVHAADLVHRDLKPSNVVLGPDGPRILDFGIVARGGVVVDGPDGVLGTKEFLAPELLDGAPATAAVDVYAWAATVAFAASGTVPDAARLAEEPDAPLPGMSAGLSGILRRSLSPDPASRPTVVEAMDLVLAAAHEQRGAEPSAMPAWGTPDSLPPPKVVRTATYTPPSTPREPRPVARPRPAATPSGPARVDRRRARGLRGAVMIAGFILLGLWQNESDGEPYTEWDPGQQWSSPTDDLVDPVRFRTDELAGSTMQGPDGVNRLPVLTVEKSSLVTLEGCSLVTWTLEATESDRFPLDRFTDDRCAGDIAVGNGNRQVAVAVGDDVTIRRLDGSGKVRTLDGGPVTDLRMSSTGSTVAGLDGAAMVVWPDGADSAQRAQRGVARPTDYVMNADGSRLATVAQDDIVFWQVGQPVDVVASRRDLSIEVPFAMSPSGTRFAVYDRGTSEIDVWDVNSRTLIMTLEAPPDAETEALAFDGLGRYLAAASGSTVRILNTVTGGPVGPKLVGPDGGIGQERAIDVMFSPDRQWVYVLHDGGGITYWPATDLEPAAPSAGPPVPGNS